MKSKKSNVLENKRIHERMEKKGKRNKRKYWSLNIGSIWNKYEAFDSILAAKRFDKIKVLFGISYACWELLGLIRVNSKKRRKK
jgi:hypothetical protein